MDPKFVDSFLLSDRAGKLSSKDRKRINAMRQSVMMSPEEVSADMAENLTSENMQLLHKTIQSTKDPAIKAVLVDEQDRLLGEIKKRASVNVASESKKPVDAPSIMNQISSYIADLLK